MIREGMRLNENGSEIGRRDWLKTASVGGFAALFSANPVSAEVRKKPAAKVKGVVFLVSDGMSPGVFTMAESYSQLTRKRGTAWWNLWSDKSTARGLMDTASANSMVTDSAAAATAWGGGERVNNGAINVTPKGKSLKPIAELLKKSGVKTGLVSTATITHATPAGFAAAVAKRNDEDSIAPQYLERVDILLGGGSVFFDAKTRPDKRDLLGEFKAAGYGVVKHRSEMLKARDGKLLGLFSRGHLPYSVDRDHGEEIAERVPTLAEMSMAALDRFLEGDAPFLLQIEGARIDHAAHLNDIVGLLGDQIAFDDAVAAVLAKVAGRDDILVVVTSDHGNANPGLNGMGAGYAQSTQAFGKIADMKASHERVCSEWKKSKGDDANQLTAMIRKHLGFTLKSDEAAALLEAFKSGKVAEWSDQLDNPEGLLGQIAGNHTGIGWSGTTHTSDPTMVSAIGPQAERFAGLVKNDDVFRHLMEILG